MTTTRGGGEIGLRSCAEATVIEDLLEVITPVSGLVKRNLDLIRQLGATATAWSGCAFQNVASDQRSSVTLGLTT